MVSERKHFYIFKLKAYLFSSAGPWPLAFDLKTKEGCSFPGLRYLLIDHDVCFEHVVLERGCAFGECEDGTAVLFCSSPCDACIHRCWRAEEEGLDQANSSFLSTWMELGSVDKYVIVNRHLRESVDLRDHLSSLCLSNTVSLTHALCLNLSSHRDPTAYNTNLSPNAYIAAVIGEHLSTFWMLQAHLTFSLS